MTKGEIKEARWHKDRKGEEIAEGPGKLGSKNMFGIMIVKERKLLDGKLRSKNI